MTIRSMALVVTVVAVVACPPSRASAQPAGAQTGSQSTPAPQGRGQMGPRGGMRGGAGAGAQMSPAEFERWVDSYVLLQAQETLQLSDAQYPAFLQRLKALQDARRTYLRTRRQSVAALPRLLQASPVDQSQVRDRLKAIRDLDARWAVDLPALTDALDQGLDLTQQARLRVFLQTVERRSLDLMFNARQRARGGMPGDPGPVR